MQWNVAMVLVNRPFSGSNFNKRFVGNTVCISYLRHALGLIRFLRLQFFRNKIRTIGDTNVLTRSSRGIETSHGDEKKERPQISSRPSAERGSHMCYPNSILSAADVRPVKEESSSTLINDQSSYSSDPVDALIRSLVAHKDGPRVSIQLLKSLYASIKRSSTLLRLSPKHLTQLITLFGTRSIPFPKRSGIYVSSNTCHIYGQGIEETHWLNVLEIAQDKEGLGHTLNEVDRYWIMRAELAKMPVSSGASAVAYSSIQRSVSLAKLQYVKIWRHSSDPELHVPFLAALLSFSSAEHLTLAVKFLCRLLRLHDYPNMQLITLLWELVLHHGHKLSDDAKSQLISLCSFRIMKAVTPKTSPSSSRKARTNIVNIASLGFALASHVFPEYRSNLLRLALHAWLRKAVASAFDPGLCLDTRWSNLLLLALFMKPHTSLPITQLVDPKVYKISEWRTILILAGLNQVLSRPTLATGSRQLDNIIWSLWRSWNDNRCREPLLVSQIILGSFLQLSVALNDCRLFEMCCNHSELHKFLCSTSQEPEAGGAECVVLAYIIGLVHHKRKSWPYVIRFLDELDIADSSRGRVIASLVRHYTPRNPLAAYELYQHSQRHPSCQSATEIYEIAMSLASSHEYGLASSFLGNNAFSPHQVEMLMETILRSFQISRPEAISSDIARDIGDAMEKSYAAREPWKSSRYPVRFFLSILITSGHPSKAIRIIEGIRKKSNSFFTVRLFARLVDLLVRRREHKLAVYLAKLAQGMKPSKSVEILRGNLVLALANAGAPRLANDLHRLDNIKGGLKACLSITRAARFRVQRPTTFATIRYLSLLPRGCVNVRVIRYTVTLLARAGRLYAARKLLEKKHTELTPEAITVIGNTILHGSISVRKRRNGQLVRQVLRMRMMLEKTCKFSPDRLTVNILMKAIFRWHTGVNKAKVKSIFDQFIRLGYPVEQHWCHRHGVPFGTPLSEAKSFELPESTLPLSFKKHVRPLYRMFIKAFYTRGDIPAAKTRKLEQAFQILDSAVASTDSLDHPPPPKRLHTSHSLYSTLAKYGIKVKDPKPPNSPYQLEGVSKSTPHLSAILSRAASRTKKAFPFKFGSGPTTAPAPVLPSTAEYRPSSTPSFLSRLATFKLSTYANKPAPIDAVAAAKCGWINEGKDRLLCGLCKSSWVVASREGMTRDAANSLVERQRHSLIEMHKDSCPWKSRQCDASIYRIPLHSPSVMLRDLKQNALALDPLLECLLIKHPLTSKQLSSLRSVTASLTSSGPGGHEAPTASRPGSPTPTDKQPSNNATLAALFGWSLVPPTLPDSSRRPSLSRASSVAPLATPPRTPMSTPPSISLLSLDTKKDFLSREKALLHCSLCQRRVGLWAFAPQTANNKEVLATENGVESTNSTPDPKKTALQRPFDLLKEHRSFCPYVVRSTTIPSMSTTSFVAHTGQPTVTNGHARSSSTVSINAPDGSLEGWRAVLTTILRYDMKQRMAYPYLEDEAHGESQTTGSEEPMEVDAVKAMTPGTRFTEIREGFVSMTPYCKDRLSSFIYFF
ncbi:hypothetical protein AMATHDRAFT_1599 [Amanita thiersii Skay4041]|uniref:C3HC-type domain-containing protein n=1 Tax=Amanita thiersii Skay4041 TaxID=703135 RepID=A0A2A9NYW4_9AGAR|nr:hypothetical protein AMATHDRAFT_1599 [Amanita thiersii Skay4041]